MYKSQIKLDLIIKCIHIIATDNFRNECPDQARAEGWNFRSHNPGDHDIAITPEPDLWFTWRQSTCAMRPGRGRHNDYEWHVIATKLLNEPKFHCLLCSASYHYLLPGEDCPEVVHCLPCLGDMGWHLICWGQITSLQDFIFLTHLTCFDSSLQSVTLPLPLLDLVITKSLIIKNLLVMFINFSLKSRKKVV